MACAIAKLCAVCLLARGLWFFLFLGMWQANKHPCTFVTEPAAAEITSAWMSKGGALQLFPCNPNVLLGSVGALPTLRKSACCGKLTSATILHLEPEHELKRPTKSSS